MTSRPSDGQNSPDEAALPDGSRDDNARQSDARQLTTGHPNRLRVATLSIIIVAVAAYFLRPANQPPANFVDHAVTVAPGVHLLGKLFPSVAYCIETDDGLVLVDTGMEPDCHTLIAELRSLGLDSQPIVAVLLTHAHGDHYYGADFLRERSGARIYAGARDVAILQAGGPQEAVFSHFAMPDVELRSASIDVELAGGESLRFGDTTIDVIATPGHTPGSLCFQLERGGQQILFSGDTVMSQVELGTYSSYLAPKFRGNLDDFLSTIDVLEALETPDLLLPGHPERHDEQPQSVTITGEEWRKLLSEGRKEMLALRETFAADGADFLDGHAKEILSGLDYLGDLDGIAVYCVTTGPDSWLVNAPGADKLVDFAKARLAKIGRDFSSVRGVLLTSTAPQFRSGISSSNEPAVRTVVVAESALEPTRQVLGDSVNCVAAESLSEWPTIDVRHFPLSEVDSMSYAFDWEDKKVVVSGPLPTKVADPQPDPTITARLHALLKETHEVRQAAGRVRQLLRYRPDVWLPAQPVHGQNANLYDDEWERAVADTQSALTQWLSR